jgi:hypothetical protein
MSISGKRLVCSLPALLAFVFVAVAVPLRMISLDTPKRVHPQRQQNPFHRSPEELAADGAEIVSLPKGQEETMHEKIIEYISTAYREEYKNSHVREHESVDTAKARIWSFSQPRAYEGLHDIVGIFALGGLHNEGSGSFGKSPRLFFFTVDGDTINLEKSLPVGEDLETYESAPVEFFKNGRASF